MQIRNLDYCTMKMLCKRNLHGFAIITALGLAMCATAAFAQSGAGAIQGTVEDSTGAVMPGTSVTVVNAKTGVSTTTKSNAAGFYVVPSLFPSTYSVTFTAPEFKSYRTDIQLQTGQTAVVNPVLTPGAVTQRVIVAGHDIQLLTKNNGTISSTLDSQRIDQLPMNGRQMLTLIGQTTPGLESGGTRANGLMAEALEYVQDGTPVINRNFGGETNSQQAQLPDPDSVQEVRMDMSASSAKFTTPSTGIITTKSGTNQLHGSIFETARNNAFGVAKARQDPADLVAPHLVRNEFGASVGGPVFIPKLYNGKDKSFFFFAYERFSDRESANTLTTVPTMAERQGDFSGAVNSNGVLNVIYDPATSQPASSPTPYARTAFTDNKIPSGSISPLAKALYAITPKPTSNDNPLINPNLTTVDPINQTVRNINWRLDHTFSEKNKAFLRFTDIGQSNTKLDSEFASIAGAGLPLYAEGLENIPVTEIDFALGYTHIFSPTFFSETNLGNQWFNQAFQYGSATNLDDEATLGLPNNFTNLGFPAITAGVVTYGGTQKGYKEAQIITNLDENLTKVVGRHQLEFGGRYRHERLAYFPDQHPDSVNFSGLGTGDIDPASGGNYTALSNTGDADADMFMGNAASYQVLLNPPVEHARDMEFDAYFQDNFHVTKNFTINAGLRWEAHPAMYVADGLNASFDLANKAMVLQKPLSYYVDKGYTTQGIITNLQNLGAEFETPAEAGLPDSVLYNYNLNFNPRFGFAYSPLDGTVIRGGYGRYIYPVPTRNGLRLTAAGQPLFTNTYTQSYTDPSQSPDGLANYILRNQQLVTSGSNSSDVVDTSSSTAIKPGIAPQSLDPHYSPDIVTEINATVEQSLPGSSALRVSYVYTHGTNLDQDFYYNQPLSTYVWEVRTGTTPPKGTYSKVALGPYDQTLYGKSRLSAKTGYSNDNSLQINYQRLYKAGYSFQIFYVYSRVFRDGGNTFRDSIVYPALDYAPGLAPGTDYKTLNRFQNYMIYDAIPKHRINFNGIVDLPVGRGKRFLGNVNRFVNELVGGFQIAGSGSVVSQYFSPDNSNFGPTSPIHVYKHAHKVNDCRSGVCHTAYQWFNGYISPLEVGEVSGLPADYTPYQTPINNDPNAPNFGNNNVPVTLSNGKVVSVAYSPGPGINPFSKTFLSGPFNYSADLSLFKVFPITERVQFRVNLDAFNAFNVQGYNNPDSSDGIESLQESANTPRQLQISGRLTF